MSLVLRSQKVIRPVVRDKKENLVKTQKRIWLLQVKIPPLKEVCTFFRSNNHQRQAEMSSQRYQPNPHTITL